ncbi:MAG: hypothetical protein ACYC1M_12760 [Armatimonadota bacterium]
MKKQTIASIGIAAVLASILTLGVSAQKPEAPAPSSPEAMMRMMNAHKNAFQLVGLLGSVRAVQAGKNPLNAKQAKVILGVITSAQAKKQLDEATASKAIKTIQTTLTDKQRKEIASLGAKGGPTMPPGGGGMMMGPSGPNGGRRMGPGVQKNTPRPVGKGGQRVGPNGKGQGGMTGPGGGGMMPPGGPGSGRRMGPGGPGNMPDMTTFNPLKPRAYGPAGKRMSPVDDLVKILKKKANVK